MIQGGGVVAQGQLLPHIQKQLGIAAAAEEGVAHQQGGGVIAAAGKSHSQLALGHIHSLLDPQHLLPGRMVPGDGDIPDHIPGQRGKGGQQSLLYPPPVGTATVKQLQPGR